jgi:hypothetical protein
MMTPFLSLDHPCNSSILLFPFPFLFFFFFALTKMKKYLRFDLFSSFFFFFRRIGIDGLGVQVLDLGCCLEYELQVFFFFYSC